eukprot:3801477-Pyramimonas_sp.AAC.1
MLPFLLGVLLGGALSDQQSELSVKPESADLGLPPSSSGAQGTSSSSSCPRPRESASDDGLGVFRTLQHRPIRYGRVIICQSCACSLVLPDGCCRGLSK